MLLYYSTVYQLFTGVSDLCNVIHNLRLRGLRSINNTYTQLQVQHVSIKVAGK